MRTCVLTSTVINASFFLVFLLHGRFFPRTRAHLHFYLLCYASVTWLCSSARCQWAARFLCSFVFMRYIHAAINIDPQTYVHLYVVHTSYRMYCTHLVPHLPFQCMLFCLCMQCNYSTFLILRCCAAVCALVLSVHPLSRFTSVLVCPLERHSRL